LGAMMGIDNRYLWIKCKDQEHNWFCMMTRCVDRREGGRCTWVRICASPNVLYMYFSTFAKKKKNLLWM
jgi:hypothetical protein